MTVTYPTEYQNAAGEPLEVWIERAPPMYQEQEAWGNRNFRVAALRWREKNHHTRKVSADEWTPEVTDAAREGIRGHEGRNEPIRIDAFIPGPGLVVYNTLQSTGD